MSCCTQAFPELVCLLFDWKVVDRAGSDSIASSDSEGACDMQNSGRSGTNCGSNLWWCHKRGTGEVRFF